MIHCYILSDDPITSALIAKLAESGTGLFIAGTAASGEALAEMLEKRERAVIFWDLDTESCNPELLHRNAVAEPDLVLVSANPELAQVAFDTGAAWFLLKPVTPDAFKKAVNRINQPEAKRSVSVSPGQTLYMVANGVYRRIRPDNIIEIRVADGHVMLGTSAGETPLLESIDTIWKWVSRSAFEEVSTGRFRRKP